jgi:hypothetical protein
LVQTGDYTDRGAHVRAVLDQLMRLEREAESAGGHVITLLGNHEVMNLIGETRDVTEAILAAFADEGSEARREAAWRAYEGLATAQSATGANTAAVYRHTRDAWMAAHPPGYLEYREALGPRGHYGRWLRRKNVVSRLAGTVFMHAGVSPTWPRTSEDAINSQVKSELARYDAYVEALVARKLALPFFSFQEILAVTAAQLQVARTPIAAAADGERAPQPVLEPRWLLEGSEIARIESWALLAPEGPLWFRGLATWPETAADQVTMLLRALKADRFVVGHTVQPQGIVSRFDGRVFLIDTGMLTSVYKGRPAALEIAGSTVTALYLDGQRQLSPEQPPE